MRAIEENIDKENELKEIKEQYLELAKIPFSNSNLVAGLIANKEQLKPIAEYYGLTITELITQFVSIYLEVDRVHKNLALAKATIDMVIEGTEEMYKPYNQTFKKYLIAMINQAGIFIANVLRLGDCLV